MVAANARVSIECKGAGSKGGAGKGSGEGEWGNEGKTFREVERKRENTLNTCTLSHSLTRTV